MRTVTRKNGQAGDYNFNFRMDLELRETLRAIAMQNNTSMAEALRNLVRKEI